MSEQINDDLDEIRESIKDMPVLPPAIVIGALVAFGSSPALNEDTDVCTLSFIIQHPQGRGILPLVLPRELAESIGIREEDNTPRGEDNHGED